MSVELSLIRRIIDVQGIQDVLEFGITEDDFTDTQAKVAWRIVLDWYVKSGTKGSTIELSIFQRCFASIPLIDSYRGQNLSTLCFLVRTNRIRREASSTCVALSASMEAPNADITTSMGSAISQLSKLIALGQVASSDIDARKGFARQIQRILDIQAGITNSVCPWPWEILQSATLGIQRDDYIVLYGRPKNMKSWVLAYLIAFFFNNEIPVVVYTKEMTPDNVYQRVVACLLRVAYQTFRLGDLTDEQMHDLRCATEQLIHDPISAQKLIVLSGRDVPPGADTVSWFKSKLDRYKPKDGSPMVGMVDGLYLLSGDGNSSKQKDNERVQSISRGLRGIPLDLGIPIIATNQANRAAAKNRDAHTDEIAFSDALAQDATLAARIISDKHTPTVSIVIGGSREFKLHGFRINALPAVDFSFHSELTEEDISKVQAADQADAEGKVKTAKTAKKAKQDKPTPVNETEEINNRVAEAQQLHQGTPVPS